MNENNQLSMIDTERNITLSALIPEEEANTARLEYYDLLGKDLSLKVAPGDLYKICNVLHDYEHLVRCGSQLVEMYEGAQMFWDIYADQLLKIRGKIEKALGYSVEKAISKCEKKKLRKESDDDVGEDAIVLAMKRGSTKKKTIEKSSVIETSKGSKTEKTAESDELSLLDFMQEK